MKMKNLLFIAITALLLFSCNKLNEKNIRGNWQIVRQTVNGVNVTPANYRAVWTFNESPNCVYSLDWSAPGLVFNYTLDKKNQILTISNFITEVVEDTSGITLFYIPSSTFNVDKNGKKMTLSNDTIVCELELIPPEY